MNLHPYKLCLKARCADFKHRRSQNHMNRYRIGLPALILLIAIFMIASLGCPGSEATQNTPEPAGIDNEDSNGTDSGENTASTDEPVTPEEELSPEEQRFMEENFGQTLELTQEEVENISEFGSILYPGAQLLPDKSTHSIYGHGSEIYNMKLGIEKSVDEVAEWYRENSEPGVEEFSDDIGSGIIVYNFSYESPGGDWMRIITVRGGQGERQCEITVNINRMVHETGDETE